MYLRATELRDRGYRQAQIPVDGVSAFEAMKKAHPAERVAPATMAHARALVRDALIAIKVSPRGGYDLWLPERVQEVGRMLDAHDRRHDPKEGWCSCARRWLASDKSVEVGSLSDVSRIFGPEHFIGMSLRRGADGWTLEHLELLDASFEALRHCGRLCGFQYGSVCRMESRSGIHYI